MEIESSPERYCIQPGIYEHYKSSPENRKVYIVYGQGRCKDAGEVVVVYRSIGMNHGGNPDAIDESAPARQDSALQKVISALHTETNEVVAVEVAMDIPDEGELPFARPATMFYEKVEVGGVMRPRFQYVGDRL